MKYVVWILGMDTWHCVCDHRSSLWADDFCNFKLLEIFTVADMVTMCKIAKQWRAWSHLAKSWRTWSHLAKQWWLWSHLAKQLRTRSANNFRNFKSLEIFSVPDIVSLSEIVEDKIPLCKTVTDMVSLRKTVANMIPLSKMVAVWYHRAEQWRT